MDTNRKPREPTVPISTERNSQREPHSNVRVPAGFDRDRFAPSIARPVEPQFPTHLREPTANRAGGVLRLRGILGSSPTAREFETMARRVARAGNATILILGESGTGKDTFAKALHAESHRSSGPFLHLTCTALPDTLLESELFGHEQGSFTDARTRKIGLLEQSHGGTIFLDEIGDMSLVLQAKILRFLEEKRFRRIGGDEDLEVDVRIIAATHRDLRRLVKTRRFRDDLYYRLKVIPLTIPPLRERLDQIPELVAWFVAHFNARLGKRIRGASPELLDHLCRYEWPGNVRELKNSIERAMILTQQDWLERSDFELDDLDLDESAGLATEESVRLTKRGINLDRLERSLVRQALELTGHNQVRAARLLGLSRDQLRYRVQKYGFRKSREPSHN